MTLFLIIASAIGALALVASAFETLGRTTATDGSSRGSWGVIEWVWSRERSMDSRELRWHTALVSGRKKANRWPDLVEEMQALERSAECEIDPNPPATFDPAWIDRRLNMLERHLDAVSSTTPGVDL